MYIVNTLKGILEAMVADSDCTLASWQYEDKPTANVRLDNKMPSPTCLFLQITDFTIDNNMLTAREKASVNLTFLEKEGKLDAGGLAQDEIIGRMKALATEFVQRLRAFKGINIINDEIKAKSVFLRSDSNRTGVNIELMLEQRQGECIGSPEPYVLEIDENGTYDVAGYAQVTVNIECPEPPVPPVPVASNCLCFTSMSPYARVGMTHYGTNKTTTKPVIYWSLDKINWTLWDYSSIRLSNIGDRVYLYGENPNGISSSASNYSTFEAYKVMASGDCTTLLHIDGTDTVPRYCFWKLFDGCTSLATAPELPATTLTAECYQYMFQGCTSLTAAPELPAKTAVYNCYTGMFKGCTSLTTAPALPATDLQLECYKSMFQGCTSLTATPTLPATTLAYGCYSYMFQGCTSLTSARVLPATTAEPYCYAYMFAGCTSLKRAPSLPATILDYDCYSYMFFGCTSLTTAPATLPATVVGDSSCSYMFAGCTSLTTAPELPATRVLDNGYSSMFSNCTSLTTAPATLPATTLEPYCYASMFQNCTSLTTAPELPAEEFGNGGYGRMFYGCSSLNWIKVRITNWNESKCANWVVNVAPTGTFHKLSALTNIPIDNVNGVPVGWTVVNDDDSGGGGDEGGGGDDTSGYVGFAANSANSTIGMTHYGTNATTTKPVIYWSTDAENWTLWDYSTITLANVGDKVYFYGENQNGPNTDINYSTFTMTGSIAVSGDITRLITQNGTTTLTAGCFNSLFSGCTSLTTAPELPATTLADYCYISMFRNCTSLTTAPELPATTLATNCYWGMFNGCTALTTAPTLPAATLANGCYIGMFGLCENLTSVSCLATDISATDCTWEWMNGVAANGTFAKAANMSGWTSGTSGIPTGWTVINYEG